MVNYLYDLDEIETNHEAFAEKGTVVASAAVRKPCAAGRPAPAQRDASPPHADSSSGTPMNANLFDDPAARIADPAHASIETARRRARSAMPTLDRRSGRMRQRARATSA